MAFAPNTETFSAVYVVSVAAAIGCARSLGGLGGRSRIEFIVSPLSRRRHNESHFAAQSPECAFLAKPFFAQAKNGVNSGRRSHKISVSEAKCNICRHKRAGALHLIRRLRRHLPLGGEGKVGIVPRGSLNERLLPECRNFLLCVRCLCQLPLPACPFPGGLGGREPVAAQSPECAFLRRFRVSGFCLRSFAQAKNGVNLRRYSHKNSVDKAKTNRSHHQSYSSSSLLFTTISIYCCLVIRTVRGF